MPDLDRRALFLRQEGGLRAALIISIASFPFMSFFHTSWQGRNVAYAVGQFLSMAMTVAYLPEAARRRGLPGRGWRQ
ncbi:hypothetical protein BQ8482_111596 [Mesorhizobium delmotii]|uniref:Uncharacterized protein n=1 Tax=Mesorhizobium delmotii TaxID=1631247 RepID=A0A2P9AEW2_9HYPH|nr:hypothetical protein BQ8482_111596 [Mesorhizobium delmotii]